MAESAERPYISGKRQAYLSMLRECLRQLGHDDAETKAAAWVSEREEAVQALRSLCESHGDNDWSEDLHLADVIEKHLGDHLRES